MTILIAALLLAPGVTLLYRGRSYWAWLVVPRGEWRTVAQGEGDDPWSALWDALQTLVPDLP